jgi:hypothetical protein
MERSSRLLENVTYQKPLLLAGIFLLAYSLRLLYFAEVHKEVYFQAQILDARQYDERSFTNSVRTQRRSSSFSSAWAH